MPKYPFSIRGHVDCKDDRMARFHLDEMLDKTPWLWGGTYSLDSRPREERDTIPRLRLALNLPDDAGEEQIINEVRRLAGLNAIGDDAAVEISHLTTGRGIPRYIHRPATYQALQTEGPARLLLAAVASGPD